MKQIELGKGYFALVDDEDFVRLCEKTWWPFVVKYKGDCWVYAATNIGTGSNLLMHRFILGVTDPDIHVDHINGNRVDNRRCNVRLCEHGENMMNRRRPRNNKSGFKGVEKRGNGWRAKITVRNHVIHIGQFVSGEEAAKAYDEAALKYHGEFARLNFQRIDLAVPVETV